MKKQIIVIHGGDTFDTYEDYMEFLKDREIDFEEYRTSKIGWKKTLGGELGSEYEVITPTMPNKMNAQYAEWKIWFEKFIPHLEPEIMLLGHSLGGTFLAKYLSEDCFPKTIRATFLIAPAFDAVDADYSMGDFIVPESFDLFAKQGGRIFLYGSTDDPVVPPADLGKFSAKLPEATVRRFTDRGHFNQESFPELVEDIRDL